ncbi:MAG: 2-phospho-L-lactate guanylyltransferase [Actinomycetota bacterium]
MRATDAAVLIPIRSFADAKTRLAGALSPDDRKRLAQAMAERVVHAARGLPVSVVTDDAAVARWAATVGADVIAPAVSGLNASVTAAVARIAAAPDAPARVIIAHADLPLADDLRIVTGPGVAVAPDADRDGSNVLSLPTGAPFTFCYGPGSFAAHRQQAGDRGLDFTVVDEPSLALDIDDPGDLIRLQSEGH